MSVLQNYINDIIRYLSLHGLFISLTMAVGYIFSNRNSHNKFIFSMLFLSFFFMESFILLLISGYIEKYFLFLSFGAASVFMLGPSLFLLIVYTVNGNYKNKLVYFLQYLPAIIGIIIITLDLMFFQAENNFNLHHLNCLQLVVFAAAYLHLGFYLVIIPSYIFNTIHYSSIKNIVKKPFGLITVVLYLVFSIGIVLDVLFFISSSSVVLLIASAIVPFATTFLFIVLFRYPDAHNAAVEAGIYQKQKRSYLKGLDVNTMIENMHDLIKNQKLYRSENFSLPELADMMDLSVHQLSELLNRHVHMNFTSYINKFRIDYACTLLEKESVRSILNICFKVGFNSKSSFNKTFKDFKGLTPGEYRKKSGKL